MTAEMRCRLLDGLGLWSEVLDQRLRYSVSSPAGVLDALLKNRG